MIIPIKCFSCGKVLANKYQFYLAEVKKQKLQGSKDMNEIVYLTEDFNEKTIEGEVLDYLKLNKQCCRRHMMTHVDIF
tara:strand:+ start:140 stop:373 length:234 start_codon:yes stop_codon:yes gene_type:complete